MTIQPQRCESGSDPNPPRHAVYITKVTRNPAAWGAKKCAINEEISQPRRNLSVRYTSRRICKIEKVRQRRKHEQRNKTNEREREIIDVFPAKGRKL